MLNKINKSIKKKSNTKYMLIIVKRSTVLKFVIRNGIEVKDMSNGQYSANRNIKFKTMLRC